MADRVVLARDRDLGAELARGQAVAGEAERRREAGPEVRLHGAQVDAVLRALGPGHRGLDLAEVELERVGVDRVGRARGPEQALGLVVGLDVADVLLVAAAEPQVGERLLVDGEEATGRAVLGRHVGDRRPVGEREAVETVAVELDELVDHALLAQHLDDPQGHVGRGHARAELAGQLEADDVGREHVDRLAEHDRLGLDAADAPAEHAQAVDHRGVAVGPDHAVGVVALALGDRLVKGDVGDPLEVDLVDDAAARRDGAEVGEAVLAPLEELVALGVALVLDVEVLQQRVGDPARDVDLDRVVDDEVDVDQRVGLLGIAAELDHRVAARGDVDDRGHAGEVLQDHPRRDEGDLAALGLGLPAGERGDVLVGDQEAVVVAQRRLEQHARWRVPGEPCLSADLGGLVRL